MQLPRARKVCRVHFHPIKPRWALCSKFEAQTNFFTAGPEATAQDVRDLIADVQAAVEAATGIYLEPEIRLIGQFQGGDHRVRR